MRKERDETEPHRSKLRDHFNVPQPRPSISLAPINALFNVIEVTKLRKKNLFRPKHELYSHNEPNTTASGVLLSLNISVFLSCYFKFKTRESRNVLVW